MCRRLVLAAVLLAGLLLPAAAHARANDCSPYASTPCLFPFPDDRLTKWDPRTDTGRRVDLPAAAMPVNTKGQAISPAEYDRNDGFSPGSAIVVHIPGLDNQAAFDRNGLVSLAHMGQAFAPRQRVVVIDERTGRRWLVWAELDANAPDAADTNLLIHPGRNFLEGHRYVVALRDLVDANGNRLAAPAWFAALRDRRRHHLPAALRAQRRRYARIFRALRWAGVSRRSLYEAWDFTVMSERSLSSRLLHIRNDAFAQLGDRNLRDGQIAGAAPTYTIDKVEDNPDPRLLRRVTGTLTVPCYLDDAGCGPGGRFHYSSASPDALPTQMPGNVQKTQFICIVPNVAATSPAHVSLYGHGLLGSPSEVNQDQLKDFAQEHDFIFCATRWSGMADEDIPNAVGALQNLDNFPTIADRLQQGVLNQLYLARLLAHPHGLVDAPAFQLNGHPLIQPGRVFYDGNSQGGIMGGITTAVSPDFRTATLGVAGMDYGGLLLLRSKDWDTYSAILTPSYPDPSLRPLLLDLIQQLWDRGEADGYAQHMTTDPLPDTPSHRVLLQIALGDQQVTDYAADTEARTIGASAHCPILDPGRIPDERIGFGIPCIGRYPFAGSAIVYWDSGPGHVDPPPLANVPARTKDDPHEFVRETPAARTQKSAFLLDGVVQDVCGGQACRTFNYLP